MEIELDRRAHRARVRRSPAARLVVAAALTAALVVAAPLAADAHVRLYPKQAVAGADDTLLTLAVPNESATASTTRVVVALPTATPFGDVSVEPVAGWTASVTTSELPHPARVDGARVTEAPTRITWTAAAGTRLRSGEFQAFVLSVGPMPDTGRILLPTVQTYSDGRTVAWNEPTPARGEEPERPAPVLYVNDVPPAADRVGGTASVQPQPSQVPIDIALAVAAAALVLALGAGVLAVAALVRLRRRGAA